MTVTSPHKTHGEIRILGIDPGSRLTGYGCIAVRGVQLHLLGHGTLKLAKTKAGVVPPLEKRLTGIYHGINEAIEKFKPHCVVVEKVFFAKNAVSALKLGQARGAVILTAALHDLPIFEYNPTEVKAAVVGHGRAEKQQVAQILKLILGRGKPLETPFETSDASDAVALALCHAQLMPRRAHHL